MGNCLGNNCTRDEPNTIIKIKNNELVINPNSIENPKEISQENKQKIIMIQSQIRGYLIRKKQKGNNLLNNRNHNFKFSSSTGKKQSYQSSLNQNNLSPQQIRQLDLEQGSKKISKTYIDVKNQTQSNRHHSLNEKILINIKGDSNSIKKEDSSSSSNSQPPESIKKRNLNFAQICFEPQDEEDQILIKNSGKLHFITMKNQGMYEGYWREGKANGFGKYIFPDRSTFTGYWANNQAEGKGTFSHPDGDFFNGEWKKNMVTGQGCYKYQNGDKYDGEWKYDLPHGQGIEEYNDKSKYIGSFRYGQKHGKGEMIFSDGSIYSGQFKNDMMNGEGIFQWYDGRKYIGQWKDGQMHGKGKLTWKDGRKYEGNYKNDKKNGFGQFCWPDGKQYAGEWEDGYQHGNGEFRTRQGEIIKGKWIKGKYQN